MSTENEFDITLNLYEDSKSRSITLDCIKSFLNNETYQKSFVANINKLLSSSSTRLDGLQLLTECMTNFSANVISEQAPFWLKCCLTNYEYSTDNELYLKTFRNIIECSQKHSEFSRKFATEFLNPILDISLNTSKDLFTKKASLECLTSCLKYYSTFCKQHKKKIEDYLLNILGSPLASLIADSGRAFIYCQNIPTIGNNTVSCITNLTLCVRKLCVTYHRCLDGIFEQWLEIERFDIEGIEPYNIIDPPLHYNSFLKIQYRTQIILNILEWFIMFLSEKGFLIVYPEEMLSALARGLSLHRCSKQVAIEEKFFSSNLMLIQTKILEVLCVKTLSLKNRLDSFFPFISEMLRDVLNRSKNCECYRNSKLFQENLYELLLKLLLIGHGLERPLQNALVSQIISYNTPSDEGVTVRIQGNLVGQSSKSKQNIILNSIASKNNGIDKTKSWTKEKLNVSISYLEGLLILMEDSLDSNTLEKLTCFLINNILLLQKGIVKAPFNVQRTQELLYEIICSIFKHDDKNIFLNYGDDINRIFVNGCINDNLNISTTCYMGLREMERVFQSLKFEKCNHPSKQPVTPKCFESSVNGMTYSDSKNTEILNLEEMNCPNMEEISELSQVEPVLKKTHKSVTPKDFELGMDDMNYLDSEKGETLMNTEEMDYTNMEERNCLNLEEKDCLNIEEKECLIIEEKDCRNMKEISIDEEEPILKKRKVEENIADLFANEFNEDYK
ncbi:uncharacterized protein LOC123674213 [Harmonia axyridis]|uniref:uncharacterized protein LOC123674213 n=1 Tax=Harmonia axyridis TaxID=115357 RepID=UPI001E277F07|nr:uncharacterized protein LOC123674213 [Harmonia axyridis]